MCIDECQTFKRMITGDRSGHDNDMERTRRDAEERPDMGETPGVDDCVWKNGKNTGVVWTTNNTGRGKGVWRVR